MELGKVVLETGKSCGFDMSIEKTDDGYITSTDNPHETSFTLKRGNENEVKTFLDGMKKGCDSMHFATTEKGTKRLMKDAETLVNRSSAKDMVEPMYKGIVHMHRTLQESFWRVIGNVCDKYANASFDARNEGAVKFCKVVKEATSKMSMPLI